MFQHYNQNKSNNYVLKVLLVNSSLIQLRPLFFVVLTVIFIGYNTEWAGQHFIQII